MTQEPNVSWKFDFYSATMNYPLDEVTKVLKNVSARYPILYEKFDGNDQNAPGKCRKFQTRSKGNFVTVFYNYNNIELRIEVKGPHTPRFVEAIRKHFPEHRVTRADVCTDWIEPEIPTLFEDINDEILNFINSYNQKRREKQLLTDIRGDWEKKERGRTRYFFLSEKGSARFCLYEKGKKWDKENKRYPLPAHEKNWVRLECKFKLQGDKAKKAATCTPIELFGYFEWTKTFIKEWDGVDVPRTTNPPRLPSPEESMLANIIWTYGESLMKLRKKHGSWDAVGAVIERDFLDHATPKGQAAFHDLHRSGRDRRYKMGVLATAHYRGTDDRADSCSSSAQSDTRHLNPPSVDLDGGRQSEARAGRRRIKINSAQRRLIERDYRKLCAEIGIRSNM